MLLIYPPLAKACEPPAGIAKLAGALRAHNLSCSVLDANVEGLFFLLQAPFAPRDTWSMRAKKNRAANIAALRSPELYLSFDRYKRAVADINRILEQKGKPDLLLSLANYHDPQSSPLRSDDLLQAAATPEHNIFYPYFSARLSQLLDEKRPGSESDKKIRAVGFSLSYLSQAPVTFAMIGFVRKHFPGVLIVMGGGLVTSWMQNPAWKNPFADLVDHMISGPGELPLLALLGIEEAAGHFLPDYSGLPLDEYLAPGFILPYAASSGCYWNKCAFCPEKAEENPYLPEPAPQTLEHLRSLIDRTRPRLVHFLDNALSPALMDALKGQPPGVDWYGFARVAPKLADPDFCKALRQSGCLMLKLGIESGDQGVLDAMHKGIDLELVSKTLRALQAAGIATYVYLLFGTPSETLVEARRTLDFVVNHSDAITFLNLAIFNMPICGAEAKILAVTDFYEADLSLYTDFEHPRGWNRKAVRLFLEQEFKRHPAIAPILQRDPPLFTSNHAPFFCSLAP